MHSKLLLYENYYRSASGRMRPTHQMIAAITRQIGRMRSTRGRRCGRRAADAVQPTMDAVMHFQSFLTNAADARPTLRPTMNRPLACQGYQHSRNDTKSPEIRVIKDDIVELGKSIKMFCKKSPISRLTPSIYKIKHNTVTNIFQNLNKVLQLLFNFLSKLLKVLCILYLFSLKHINLIISVFAKIFKTLINIV